MEETQSGLSEEARQLYGRLLEAINEGDHEPHVIFDALITAIVTVILNIDAEPKAKANLAVRAAVSVFHNFCLIAGDNALRLDGVKLQEIFRKDCIEVLQRLGVRSEAT